VQLLNIWTRSPRLEKWEEIVQIIKNPRGTVNIAIVGKYVNLRDSYKSLNEALVHGGIANHCRVNLHFVDSEVLCREGAEKFLAAVDGVLVPGGFGNRGIEGKILAAQYAREMRLPYLGICLGMQLAVVEFARHVCGLEGANSSEFNAETPHPVIDLLPEQRKIVDKGGTMRLGAYPAVLQEESLALQAYEMSQVSERHRHRYEVNNDYRENLSSRGLFFSGLSPDGRLVEMVELRDHPWFVGCQFHPELKSRPHAPHPLFRGFIQAALREKRKKRRKSA
jgi:CTP synthase